MKNNHAKKVCIFMATYNGEKYIKAQLESIEKQTYKNWELHVSDDKSTDETYRILLKFKKKHKEKVFLYKNNQNIGFALNFLSLINNKNIIGDYYAFCDQDDIWLKNKIEIGCLYLDSKTSKPLLFCSRSQIIDENNNLIGLSPKFHRKTSFNNALVQNIASGNTMLFNNKLRELLSCTNIESIEYHDWLSYLITTANNGKVFYFNEPTIKYRKHSNNSVGINTKLNRSINILKNKSYKKSIDINIRILLYNKNVITDPNLLALNNFIKCRSSALPFNLWFLYKSKVYTQRISTDIALFIMTILKSI